MNFMNTFYRRFFIVAASALFLAPSFAQKNKNVLDLKYSIEDSAIVFPESLDADTQKLMERWYLKNYTTTDIEATKPDDPGATDEQIRQRLAALPTIIEMPYNNIVKSYIERFTKKGRKQVTALLGLSTYYIPIFEEALIASGLPQELKYLPIVESGLDPTATSKSGAAGLWQFMPATARQYQMELSSLVDERRDPYVSTRKACELLKNLYDTFGDWGLAIAAYNCGDGTVKKAIARAGGDASSHDYWSIYYYLPAETRGYLPMFIATNYVMEYHDDHDIYPVLPTKKFSPDTVKVTNRVHFDQIAAVLDIPLDEIRILNPQFSQDIIPGSPEKPYNLTLPSQQIHAYVVSEDQILDYEAEKYARRLEANPGDANVTAVEMVEDPYNPADIAVVEARAAEQSYEITHPEPQPASQPATPVRRRTVAPAASAQPAQPSSKAVATAPAPAAPKQAVKPAPAPTAAAPKAAPKKSETAPKQSAASKKASESASANSKSKAKESPAPKANAKAADSKSKDNKSKAADSKSKESANSKSKAKDTKADSKSKKGKEAAPAKPKEHTVSNGENLTVIAKKTGVSVEELKKANPKLKNSDLIRPGDKINVPSKSKASADKSSQSQKKDSKQASSKSTQTTSNKKKK